MPFKKRRIKKSPNKNTERSQRNQESEPSLSQLFPGVGRLTLDLRYLGRQGEILEDEHVEYNPQDEVFLLVSCPGGCNDGQTNLEAKIGAMISQHQTTSEGRAKCAQQLFSSADICGCELVCRIQVDYAPS